MGTVSFTFRMDENIRKELKEEAKIDNRSSSYLANEAIKQLLTARKNKRKAIDEALVEADKGVFVSEEAVNKWVDSWGSDNEEPKPKADVFSD